MISPIAFSMDGPVYWISYYRGKVFTVQDSSIHPYIEDVLPILYETEGDPEGIIYVDYSGEG